MTTIICFVNSQLGQYFFSTSHIQRYESNVPLNKDWIPISTRVPHEVVPRPSVPSGIVESKADYIAVYHNDAKEVPNPDPKFQPA